MRKSREGRKGVRGRESLETLNTDYTVECSLFLREGETKPLEVNVHKMWESSALNLSPVT